MAEHIVADDDEIEEGERFLIQLEGREIAIFRIEDELYAYVNWCAHQAGPCCEGSLTGTSDASWDPETLNVELDYTRDGKILNCPWHGWEYDVTTGDCLSRPSISLPSYPVEVRDQKVIVDL